jgi:predicted flap endonuclease-1-like 5' DNA nuclease
LKKSIHTITNNNEIDKEDLMAKIIDIEGVGVVYAEKLKGIGISTTNALLEKGTTPKGRKEIAEKTGISDSLILEWVNHVDLYRIRGVASEYSDLLEESGVDTVRELAQRNAENLYQKITAVNQQKKLVRRIPTQKQVHDWIEQAKRLPGVITY